VTNPHDFPAHSFARMSERAVSHMPIQSESKGASLGAWLAILPLIAALWCVL
jgi:hypothetical protein